jgi:hypothetical protein
MSSRTARRLASVVAAAVLSLSLVPAAVAAAGPATSAAKPHCASLLSTPAFSGQTSKVTSTRCFRTLAPALRYASKGAVVPSGITPSGVDDRMLRPAAKLAPEDVTTIIGIHWEHAHRGGRDRIYFVQGAKPCAGGRVWQISDLDKGWDTIASSAEAFGGCGTFTQFEEPRFKGLSRTCAPYCATFGPLNDAVGSIRWRA